jgi:hypothetical protein
MRVAAEAVVIITPADLAEQEVAVREQIIREHLQQLVSLARLALVEVVGVAIV